MNQAEFARRHGVSRKTVTQWKERGWLVMNGREIDVSASDAMLEKYRKTVIREDVLPEAETLLQTGADEYQDEGDDEDMSPDKVAERIMLATGATMSLDEARRVKENYLALLTKLEYQQKEGELVDLTEAKEVLFACARQSRDAWMNWPARVAPLMAADLDIPADRMTEVLTAHVHKQISLLGEPEFYITEE
ncbi:hypothetical protein LB105_000843 [Salmonella enterica]|uniref:RNA polymerase subunit sigma-70 n=3 Tax=Salmonella enterica TaxID=28901 RepID=A0A765FWN2_SALER|nr:hypothetical protein [Salmonella enterica]EBS4088436.1 hypothetical protein [Salmonella enterica subsp. enterica serovar Newport]EBW9463307.1 hypothetical protein [Salmonella enterica subsp. enterica serovar Panama]ECC9078366.1 hypothetical protein [Salmonella enterica subsp. enterica]ECD7244642.1 hypothetical protein [Salmonella enterica subsp. enterica serovar Florida]ASD87100.1 hypothetical protein LFZ16_13040 [Salmonella enterica subsp. enterica serovar India str. SA20085604]